MGELEMTALDDWKRIGSHLKELQESFRKLTNLLHTVPKKIWAKNFFKIEKYLGQIRSDLESRMFKEHPNELKNDKNALNIFYGDTRH